MQTKTEYQIRSATGRVVMIFDEEDRARKWYKNSFVSNKLFKVTTTVEELPND